MPCGENVQERFSHLKIFHFSGKEKGEIELSESTDVYALGTVWYEILAGHWPWPGHSPEQVCLPSVCLFVCWFLLIYLLCCVCFY